MAIVWIILVDLLCVQLVSGVCQQAGKSGPGCVYDCHCNNATKCDESSDCQGQCVSGWRGRTCQRENVALNRPAFSSPALSGNGATKAVDGSFGERKYDQFNTVADASYAWWSVDLGFPVSVKAVIIYFRIDYKIRRNGIQFYYSNTQPNIVDKGTWCHTVISQNNGTDIADDLSMPSCIGTWRYFFIYSTTSNDNGGVVLDFSEVEIYGCSSGTYGSDCTMFCDGCNSDGCEPNGLCKTGCRPGRTNKPNCNQGCQQGYYGPDCATLCSSRRCRGPDTSTCNTETGTCQNGCTDYFTGNDCQVCVFDRYGNDCSRQCNARQCINQQTSPCDRFTSACNPSGCRPGYTGLDCYTPCSGRTYGHNCAKSCESRKCLNPSAPCTDIAYGNCYGPCIAGYGGNDCTVCSNANYGENCSKPCTSRHCRISSSCDSQTGECVGACENGWRGIDCVRACQSGSYGAYCSTTCSSRHCLKSDPCDHVNGTCTSGCSSGWRGTDCTQSCMHGMYGENCLKPCIDRKCNTSSSSCDGMTGQCPDGCQKRWSGIDCLAQCPAGTYGSECLNCSSRHCSGDQTCPSDGRCSQGCQSGWILDTCTQACPSGLYGQACNVSCGKCTNQTLCHHVTGSCQSGCEPGWTRGLCQSPCDRDHYGPDCTLTCVDRHCVTLSTCSPSTGQCDGGCQTSWTGTDCMETSSLGSQPTVDQAPVVAGAVAAVVVIILIVVIAVVIWRRRKKGSENEAKPDHVYYNTAQPGVKVNEPGSEIRQSVPVGNYDSIDAMSRDDGDTYTTIGPTDQGEAVGVSEHVSDVTTREYEPVSGRTYEKLTSTSRDHDGDYTGLQRRNSYENVR